jgi:Tfp pilus assembly protein PilF
MSTVDLNQAVQFYKDGNKEQAAQILTAVLKQDPKNEAAWLWMAACSDKLEERRMCLEKALEINPKNEKARLALEKLAPALGMVQTAGAVVQQPSVVENDLGLPENTVIQVPEKAPKKVNLYRRILVIGFMLLLLVIIGFLILSVISGAISL